MKAPKIVVTDLDEPITKLVTRSDHRKLAIWAADCAERVLPLFEDRYPEDDRPRRAIEACRTWARTGIFRMADVRSASLAAHAAARAVTEDRAARSAARAAGQAMATAHVPTHAIAAALYAATAVRDAASSTDDGPETTKERQWQYRRLLGLAKTRQRKPPRRASARPARK